MEAHTMRLIRRLAAMAALLLLSTFPTVQAGSTGYV